MRTLACSPVEEQPVRREFITGEQEMNDILFDVERTKEEFLRQELRGSRVLLVNLMACGVAILAAAEIFLYYIRQDVTAHMREIGQLGAAALLPFVRYSMGTV